MQVAKSNEQIQAQREVVIKELGEAEPALLEAREAVGAVKKALSTPLIHLQTLNLTQTLTLTLTLIPSHAKT